MDPESLRPNKKDIVPLARPQRHIKPWQRAKFIVPTVAITAAAGVGIGLTTTSQEAYSGSPTATYSAQEIPGQPNYHSVNETFNALQADPNIAKTGSINIAPIAEQFTTSEYNYNGHSVPVMEVRFDKTTDQFTYQVQTPKGLDNQEIYQLLLPVMQNAVMLKAAFQNGTVTRVAIRLSQPNDPGEPASYTTGDEYDSNDTSSPQEGKQKTVFMFLPGVPNIDTQEVTDTTRHEIIHSLTEQDSLSVFGEKPTTTNPEELAKWNAVCSDMRDFSLQDAEKYKQSSIETLHKLSTQMDNAQAAEVINEIITALQDGTFDRYQPQKPELPDSGPAKGLTEKVPDCLTIGPWESLILLMYEKGLGPLLINLEKNTIIDDTSQTLQINWDNMIQSQTIYRVFREGTYEQDSPGKFLGHEYWGWDELITSTSDVCIAYPDKVAAMIKSLPPDRRAVALQLVHLSLTNLNEQIPPDKSEDFHNLIFKTLSTIIQQVK